MKEHLEEWAVRLALALRRDDADAFIAVYDALLSHPSNFSADEVDEVKEHARLLSESEAPLDPMCVAQEAHSHPEDVSPCNEYHTYPQHIVSTLVACGSDEASLSLLMEPPRASGLHKGSQQPTISCSHTRTQADQSVQTDPTLESLLHYAFMDDVSCELRERWLRAGRRRDHAQ
mmetsp:Transcript_15834/g.42593  ORF Transcript_15834/g.42593 Transcript_15834/m.42593 type:complete len:175 (+) Transcript_15834:36-560(+)